MGTTFGRDVEDESLDIAMIVSNDGTLSLTYIQQGCATCIRREHNLFQCTNQFIVR